MALVPGRQAPSGTPPAAGIGSAFGRAAGAATLAAAAAAKPWLIAFTRCGFAAKGAVQLLVGALALAAALGNRGGRVTDAAGAMVAMGRESFGRPVLLLIALGLFAYATFRLVQGILDPESRPRTGRVAMYRLADILSGLAYLLLAYGTFRLFLGTGAPVSGDVRSRTWSGEALALPYGSDLLMVFSLVLFAMAAWFLARAIIVKDVCTDLAIDELGPAGCRTASLLIRVASLVQTTIFGTMAYLFFRAALVKNPAEVRGMGGVLRLITAEYGTRVLAVLAVGFLAMAGSSFVEARYRKLP